VRRALIVIAWGVAGLLVAGGLSLGAFAIAGNDLGSTTQVSIHSRTERAFLDRESPSPREDAHDPGEDAGQATASPTPDDDHSPPGSDGGGDRDGDD
jgi:hypothetical protein